MPTLSNTTLEYIILTKYGAFVLITVVMYDYALTLSNEIEYVWRKPWTWVSTLFVLGRYAGLCWVIPCTLVDSGIVHGPKELNRCTTMLRASAWSFLAFISAADLVMIMRVYAMWNRSLLILWILLLIYVPQSISYAVIIGIYDSSNAHFSVTPTQVLNFTFCAPSFVHVPRMLNMYTVIPRSILCAALLFLSAFQCTRQSIELYRLTKRWQPNRYMRLFLHDGILYFVANTANVIQLAPGANNVTIFINYLICYVIICPMMPRFIISVRKLYERELCRRWQGIDTGFGVISQSASDRNAHLFTAGSTDATPRGAENPGDIEGLDAIQLEVLGDTGQDTGRVEHEGEKVELALV